MPISGEGEMDRPARRILPFFALLLLACPPVYGGLFGFLLREWAVNEWARYGVFIPAMAIFIGYVRKDQVELQTRVRLEERVIGFLVTLSALLAARSFGYYAMVLGLPFFAAGLFLMFYGLHDLKVMLPAFLFLFFLIPPQAQTANQLGYFLVQKEAGLAMGVLKAFIPLETGSHPGYMTVELGDGDIFVFTPACSSGYILIPFISFSLFIALTVPGEPRRKMAMAFLALPVIFAINSMRLAAILAIGYYFGDELAFQVFHLFGGLTMFLLFIVAYLAVTTKMSLG
jgi:exosortase/archaeosortase family protein